MKVSRTLAIVLKRTNYAEADRILDLLTPNGRYSVIARGVRKEKSKLAGGIELFAVCDLTIGEGKGDLGIVTSARLVSSYRHILNDYDRMQFAYDVLAQVAYASASLDEPQWYEIVSEVLAALDDNSISLELVQTWFYIRIAQLLGEELNTQIDGTGEKLKNDVRYRYDMQEKSFFPDTNGSIRAEHIKIFRLLVGNPLRKVVQVGGLEDYLGEAVYVARQHAALPSSIK